MLEAAGARSALFERLCSFENLLCGLPRRGAARGKRSRPNMAAFDFDMKRRLLRLRDQLRDDSLRPYPYRRFSVADPKPRVISAAPFEDCIVHHALVNVLEPRFERRFIRDSSANRLGTGTYQALDRAGHGTPRQRGMKVAVGRMRPAPPSPHLLIP